jgi:hypothetical protein
MRFPESVTNVLLEVGAGAVVGLRVRVPGDADRWGPGEPDFERAKGPFAELCRSLPEPPTKNPLEFPYTEDMARGFGSL